MNKNDFSKFEYWQKQREENLPDITGANYDITGIDEETIFLWTSMSGPPPCSGGVGMWELIPNVDMLIGYLRYVSLPRFFEVWLNRDSWDKSEDMIRAEELFSRAESTENSDHKEDIPVMNMIINEIDKLFDLPDDQKYESLETILDKFNKKFDNNKTWSFELNIFKNAVSVGEELFENDIDQVEDIYFEYFQDDEVELDEKQIKKQWLNICKEVYDDNDCLDMFLDVLRSSNYY